MTYWHGKMDTPGRQFRFVIEVLTLPDSPEVQATLISLDEGAARFPLANFVADDRQLKFEILASQAKYQGTRDPAESRVTGFWEQRGGRFALDFQPSADYPVDQATESWRGTLSLGAMQLLMQFRVYESADGQRTLFVDSLTQKAGGFTAEGTSAAPQWSLEVPALRATFQAEVLDDGQTLKGQWTQGLVKDLELRRVPPNEPVEIARPRRPQTPQPPFPYGIQEVQVPTDEPGRHLAGTLTLPPGSGPFPLAILISGSGPQDRNSTLFDHQPFWVWADHLTRQGIAVLRYDERGVGQSPGDFARATSVDFADDVAAAVRFARQQPAIDPQQVGLIGHSEGGLIAPWVAAQDPQVAWIVLLAAPGVNGEQILYSQGQLIVAAEGGDADQLRQQRQIQAHLFQAVKRIPAEDWTEEMENDLVAQLREELRDSGVEISADDERNLEVAIRNGLKQINAPWFRHFLTYEPAPTLERVRCPVLAINGSLDLQVDPALNLPKIQAALEQGGNADVTVQELPNLNHLFQTCDSGAISRYAQIEETLAPAALEAVSAWIRRRVRPSSPAPESR
jgi:pimeloyl-ACP methyl ester carboxylesterase